MKYYAIRQIQGIPCNKILTSWDECKALVNGKSAEYKSFKTEQDAKDYLGNYEEEAKEEDIINKGEYIYYVDGSYMNDTIGWGFILTKNDTELTRLAGSIKPTKDIVSRNIHGELEATKMAVRHAIANGIKDIYIVYDYQGISSYVTGAWKADKQESKDYTNWILQQSHKVSVNFIKVKGHTNHKWNDAVDELAKLGTTL